jgi:hypothetical protein
VLTKLGFTEGDKGLAAFISKSIGTLLFGLKIAGDPGILRLNCLTVKNYILLDNRFHPKGSCSLPLGLFINTKNHE